MRKGMIHRTPAFRARHGFDSIFGPLWRTPEIRELRGYDLGRYRKMLGVG